jgi:ATP-dependent helicase/nuclease subunit A
MPANSQLTDQQRRAILTRRSSVALAAGAGCGKTHVLTERFLSHLDPDFDSQPAQLSELVAITFTDRAARVLRDRFRRSCHQRLLAADGQKEAEHWLKLVRKLDAARVSTIHSFCGSLLRSHAVEAGIDPRFRTLEQNQANTLLAEVLDDQLRTLLRDRQPAAMELVVLFGLDGLRGMVRTILSRADQIRFDEWLARTPAEIVARWQEFHRDVILPWLLSQLEHSPHVRALRQVMRTSHCEHPVMRERCAILSEVLARLATTGDPCGDMQVMLDNARVQGAGSKKHWSCEEDYEQFKNAAAELRKEVDKLQCFAAFDAEAALPAAEAGRQLLEVAAPVQAAYQSAKRELGCLDFNDLLVRARDLLTHPEQKELRKALSNQIKLLLVDEFQDTDPLQVELVKAMCNHDVAGGKLFFVGDSKQSIYRFRRADPAVFHDLTQEIPSEGRLPLTENFRSQPAILSFVNALFCDALGEAYQPLVPHRPQVSPTPAVEFLWAPTEAGPDDPKESVAALRRREADWLARRLKQLHDSREPLVWDHDAPPGQPAARPAEWGDMALLFRALSDVQQYEEALRSHGIPYYLVGGHAFYAQQEVFDLLNLLRSVDSQCDEVSLAGALRSPFFSLTDETLYWLAQHPEGLAGGLFGAIPKQLSKPQRQRARFAAELIADLRARKDRVPIATLILDAIAATGYDAALLAEFLGERKLANLHKLIDQARSFDQSAMFTLSDFITQLAEFVSQQPKEALAATHPESSNVVKLMTIHMSKGLEFPIVALPDLGRRLNSSYTAAAFHPELGPLVKPRRAGGESGPCGLDLHLQMENRQEEAERLRLLYVATTRAADYLLLSSGITDIDKPEGPWMTLLASRFELDTGRLTAALPADYAAPQIHVTAQKPALPEGKTTMARGPRLAEMVEATARLANSGDVEPPPHCGPVRADLAQRRQFSFSALSGAIELAERPAETIELDRLPLLTVQLDPLALGTLVHAILADLAAERGGDVEKLISQHAVRHLADAATAAEARAMIRRFLESPRWQLLRQAAQAHIELEFLLAWPPEAARADCRYLQGFIDCLYQDAAGAWHLLDYKTNQVDASHLDAAAAGYEMQMLVYALAVEQILGQPPASMTLHFLRPGAEKQFAFTKASPRKQVDSVNQAIESLVAGAASKQQRQFE